MSTNAERKIAVVVPACNLADLTVKCIQRIIIHVGDFCRIVYVDNGSDEENLSKVRAALRPEIDAQLRMDVNQMFSRAINAGCSYAIDYQPGCECLLLLNNDAFIGPDTVQILYDALQRDSRLVAVGPLTDGPGVHSISRGTRPSRFGQVLKQTTIGAKCRACRDAAQPDEIHHTNMVAFFCTLIRAEAWRTVGELDELNFKNGLGADDDWCIRARRMGYRVGIAPASFCEHMGAQSFRALGQSRKVDYGPLRRKHGGLT